jgi:hypothetical protein
VIGKDGQTEDGMKAQLGNMTVDQFNAMRNCFDSMGDNSSTAKVRALISPQCFHE